MNRGKFPGRLGVQLALAAVFSLLAAGLLFLFLNWGAYLLIDRYGADGERVHKKEEAYAKSLQDYVTGRGLKISQAGELSGWLSRERYLFVAVYDKNKLIYSSDTRLMEEARETDPVKEETEQGGGKMPEREEPEQAGAEEAESVPGAYVIRFEDGTVSAVLLYFAETAYYTVAEWVCGLISFLCFLVLLISFIRGKMNYIRKLEQELSILKGGDLNYAITVKGNDELASLAAELDEMRRAIKQRIEREEEARQANRELVTAMSHDLRTPLTSLLGYVDILNMGRFRDEEQKKRCLRSVGQKAYQIKELSDKLFGYFIVFGSGRETLKKEEVNGAEFLGQVVEESLFDLESEGFQIRRIAGEISCRLMVDMGLSRRVFGNVFSNLLKYGDRNGELLVEYRQNETELTVRLVNQIDRGTASKESSGIGLKTCGKIMEAHEGRFESGEKDGKFYTEVKFPCYRAE